MNSDYLIRKYPRTPHLEGSRLQPGDEDLSQVPFESIAGRHLVVEEKIDGANTGISFDDAGKLLLQSRGHYLTGGYRERHYNLMKQWAALHKDVFYSVLGSRYIMYGEWMYAKHTVYYDALPHYFMEFDIYDRETGIYLDTPSRRRLTSQMPVCSVPVLAEGAFTSKEKLLSYLGNSNYKTEHSIDSLRALAEKEGLDADRICGETDPSPFMEGLYIKIEENGRVEERVKFVRAGFSQCAGQAEGNWLDKPIIPNGLCRPLEDIFNERLC
ncbi:MAG: RNA ligase family protein [Oscillospiraceae bacterium]|nr:RNA ligase family protein [Oscillospiraceae bacterium]